MNKKHHRSYKNMEAALEKARVAIALMAVRMEEMRTHLDLDAAAIESPKAGRISQKKMKKELKKRTYVRG